MRKLLLFLMACLLFPALVSAENKQIRFGGGSYNTNSKYKSYTYRVLLPYNGSVASAPMTEETSFTLGMWIQPAVLNYTNTMVKDKGGVLVSFGTDKNCDYVGNWNLSVAVPGSTATEGTVTIRGTESDPNSAANVGFAGVECKPIKLKEWTYVAVVVDNTNLKATVYYNNDIAAQADLTAPMYYSGADAAFAIGGLGWSTLYLDELQLFDTALTPQQIATAQLNPNAISSLQALYTFETRGGSKNNEFSNVLYNGHNAVVSSCETWVKAALVAGEGMQGVTNDAYSYTNPSTSTRVLALPIDVDTEIQNGSLTFRVGDGESTTSAAVTPGTIVTLEGVPAEGYRLVNYYAIVSGVKSVIEGTTFDVQAPTTFSADFSNEAYALEVVNDCNIPYTITLRGEEVNDITNLIPGTDYKMTLDVPAEILLKNVTLNEKVVNPDYTGVYTFQVNEASTLVINAAPRQQFTVTYPTYDRGTVKVKAGDTEIASGATILEGTVITINVVPAEGYVASSILLNGTKIFNGSTYTVNRDVEIVAHFISSGNITHCVPAPIAGNSSTTNQTGRYFTTAEISDGTNSLSIANTGAYANSAFGNARGRKIYDGYAVIPQFIAEPGKTISVTTTGDGQWMDTYIFFDSDLNGLDSNDLVDFNAGGKYAFCGTRSFTIPVNAKTGVYRVRYMLNWIEKADGQPSTTPNPCEYGQSGKDNGEIVFDFDLVVVANEYDVPRTITVASENEAYGTVAIVDPATDEKSITTTVHFVGVNATPAEGYSFINWTDAEGNELSTSPAYEYDGEADIELTAHFGYVLSYTVEGNGSVMAQTADGKQVVNGGKVPVGAQVEFTLTPAAGKIVTTFTVNGENHVGDLVDNCYTVTVNGDTQIAIAFDDFTARISWTVRGNGEVEAGYAWNDEYTGVTDTFESGDAISVKDFNNEGGLTMFVYPGQAASGDYESVESVTLQSGDADAQDISSELLDDGGENGDGLLENGAPFYYYTISALPSADLMIVFVFTQDGQSASIENIFGDDNTDAPTLYYNIDGVRVNGNALTPGIYIVKKGKKTAKVYVM